MAACLAAAHAAATRRRSPRRGISGPGHTLGALGRRSAWGTASCGGFSGTLCDRWVGIVADPEFVTIEWLPDRGMWHAVLWTARLKRLASGSGASEQEALQKARRRLANVERGRERHRVR